MLNLRIFFCLILFLVIRNTSAQNLTIRVNNNEASPVLAAQKLIQFLPDSLKNHSRFALNDTERLDWNYIPKSRKGIPIGSMNKECYQATFNLLHTSLSEKGYIKVVEIITELEPLLKQMENRKPEDHYRDPGKYYLSFFGSPEYGMLWGWRLEGHHVSCNFLFKGEKILSGTPAFLGSNPARILSGQDKGKEVLHGSINYAFDLIHTLDKIQLTKVRISEFPEINSIQGHTPKPIMWPKCGISISELNPTQRIIFWSLVNTYLENFKPELANNMLSEMKASGNDKIMFGWKGGLTQGRLYYYRIQSPSFVIEHDNTQNEGNHVHSLTRDLHNDFGMREL